MRHLVEGLLDVSRTWHFSRNSGGHSNGQSKEQSFSAASTIATTDRSTAKLPQHRNCFLSINSRFHTSNLESTFQLSTLSADFCNYISNIILNERQGNKFNSLKSSIDLLMLLLIPKNLYCKSLYTCLKVFSLPVQETRSIELACTLRRHID